MSFDHAINELGIHLHTMETNEPINRSEGNLAQADLEAEVACSLRAAIAHLQNGGGSGC